MVYLGGAKRHAEGGGVADRTDIGTGQKRGDYEAINRVKAKLTGNCKPLKVYFLYSIYKHIL